MSWNVQKWGFKFTAGSKNSIPEVLKLQPKTEKFEHFPLFWCGKPFQITVSVMGKVILYAKICQKFSPAAGYKSHNCCYFLFVEQGRFLSFNTPEKNEKLKFSISLKTPKMRFLDELFWIISPPCFCPFQNKGGK